MNLFTIFSSPRATFERMKDSKTAWILPAIVSLVLGIITIMLQQELLINEAKKALLKQEGIDPSTVDAFANSTVTFSYVGVVLSIAFIFLIALLFMLLNLIIRGEAKYMQLVNVASYGWLPSTVGGVLTAILVKLTNAKSVTDVALNFGVFIPDKASILYKLMTLLDPFMIWSLCLVVIGLAVMMKRSYKTVAIWVVGFWLLVTVIPMLF